MCCEQQDEIQDTCSMGTYTYNYTYIIFSVFSYTSCAVKYTDKNKIFY